MKFRLRLLASLALAFAPIGNVFACSCITRITTAEHYAAAKHIFIGRVISLHEIKSRPSMPGGGGLRVGVQMEEMLKGIRPFSLALSTGHGAGDCGVPMFVGSSYIFFVDANDEIDICSGTKPYLKGHAPSEEYLSEIKTYGQPPKAP